MIRKVMTKDLLRQTERAANSLGNIYGSFKDERNAHLKKRLLTCLRNPTSETWDNAFTIILSPKPGFGLTLWQAVLEVYPVFPKSKGADIDDPWPVIPPQRVIALAICNAANLYCGDEKAGGTYNVIMDRTMQVRDSVAFITNR